MDRIFSKTIKCAFNSAFYVPLNSLVGRGIGTYSKTLSVLPPTLRRNEETNFVSYNSYKLFHTVGPRLLRFDGRNKDARKALKAVKEEGTVGESVAAVDNIIRGFGELFPDEDTPNKLFEGVKFSNLPIVHVKVSRNNTIITISDAKGVTSMRRSCGMDGFKNSMKGTNVAAQVTAQAIAVKALDRGIKNVRIAINGLGPGRAASMKGLQLGGLNIVSISDVTPISFQISPRPRKMPRK